MPELRTARPLGYYISWNRAQWLEQAYGAHLQEMPINDRNCLMLCLSSFIYINSIPIYEGTSLSDCAESAVSADIDVTSEDFANVLDALTEITLDQARSLLHAISS